MGEKNNQKKKKLIVRIILAIILIILLLLTLNQCGYIRFPGDTDPMVVGNIEQGSLPGMSDEELLEELQNQANESGIRIQLNSQPVFEDGSSEGSLFLGNPESNQYDMRVVITSEETNEILYESGLIPPTYHVAYDKLQVELEAGTHRALATVSYLQDETVISNTEFTINIIIQN